MNSRPLLLPTLCVFLAISAAPIRAQYQYPFQDPNLPEEVRVTNIVSLMTLDEKVAFLSQRSGVPRLGIKPMGHVEGLHGLAQGGPNRIRQRTLGIPCGDDDACIGGFRIDAGGIDGVCIDEACIRHATPVTLHCGKGC